MSLNFKVVFFSLSAQIFWPKIEPNLAQFGPNLAQKLPFVVFPNTASETLFLDYKRLQNVLLNKIFGIFSSEFPPENESKAMKTCPKCNV